MPFKLGQSGNPKALAQLEAWGSLRGSCQERWSLNDTISPPRISTAAERMRRHRQRRRDGLRCLNVELRATEVDALARIGLLNRDDRNDDGAVFRAFYAFLDHSLN